jgi:beta-lactamase class C
MTTATIGRAGLQASGSWARPHRLRKTPAIVEDAYYRVPAAGGVNSSINDLARWMLAQMGEAPEVLPPDALAAMHQARVATPPRGPRGPNDPTNTAYGLGWRSFTYDGHNLVGHRGTVDGYASLILFDPVDRSGIVMLWNANYYRPARLQFEFFDMLYGLPPTDRLELDDASKAQAPATAAEGHGAKVEIKKP